jgi:hypothetical protein
MTTRGILARGCRSFCRIPELARGSRETEAQIEEYWRLGCAVLNLPGNGVSTYLDGLKARAGRAHARLKSIGVTGAFMQLSALPRVDNPEPAGLVRRRVA